APRLPLVASLGNPPLNSLAPSGSLIAKAEPFDIPSQAPQQTGGKAVVATPPTPVAPPEHRIPEALQAPDATAGVDNQTPFAYGDFSWLNGSARTKDTVLDTKFFTPEARFDTHYMTDFNQP